MHRDHLKVSFAAMGRLARMRAIGTFQIPVGLAAGTPHGADLPRTVRRSDDRLLGDGRGERVALPAGEVEDEVGVSCEQIWRFETLVSLWNLSTTLSRAGHLDDDAVVGDGAEACARMHSRLAW